MDILTFPYEILRIKTFQADILGSVISGGLTQSGQQQVVNATGGGIWSLKLEFPRLVRPEQIRAWRAMQYGQRGGVVPINLAICDLRQAPRPAGGASSIDVPHSDGSPFSDTTLYRTGIIAARLSDGVALGGTRARITVDVGSAVQPGHYFSLARSNGGHELKTVVSSEPLGPGVFIVSFLPPARQAHSIGEAVEFDHPMGTWRLTSQDAMSHSVENGRTAQGQAAFYEYVPGAVDTPAPGYEPTPFDFAAYLRDLVT